MRLWLAAVVVYGLLLGPLPFGTYDRLPDWGETAVGAVLLLAHIGFGFLLNRWPAVLLGGLWLPLYLAVQSDPLRVFREGDPWTLISAVAGALGSALFILLGVAARKALTQREAGSSDRVRRSNRFGIALTALGLLPWAGVAFLGVNPIERNPVHPLTLDERTGTYRRLELGDSQRRVLRVLGPKGPRTDPEDCDICPLREDYYEIGGPPTLGGAQTIFRFDNVAVFFRRKRVSGFMTTDPDAETNRGAGIGDSLAVVEGAYPDAKCEPADRDGESETPSHCEVELDLDRRHFIWFGEDPVQSITFSTSSF